MRRVPAMATQAGHLLPEGDDPAMPTLRLFAQAREVAGTAQSSFAAATVADLLDAAVAAFGPDFARVLAGSRIWVNGEPAYRTDRLGADDEVAVIPPVSGG